VCKSIIDAFNCWIDLSPGALDIITHLINLLHNSSLMLDDIEDRSQIRRGKPAVHTIYGQAQTINSANMMYALSVAEVHKLSNPKCMDIFLGEPSPLTCA
jgi:geranylgeranyl diphosphate synthase type 3